MERQKQVVIIGAGPVGLTLACFLTQQNIPVRILESRSGPVNESRALGVHARTLELLRPLGLDRQFIQHGRVTHDMHFHNTNKKLFSLRFGALSESTPYPFYLILPQTITERLLLQWLNRHQVHVEWNTTLEEFQQTDDQINLTVQRPKGRENLTTAYLVGCDGANSTVRQTLNIDFIGETYEAVFSLAEVNIREDKIETDATHVYLADQTTCAVIPMPSGRYRIVGPNSAGGSGHDFAHFQHFLDSNHLFTDLSLYAPDRIIDYKMHKRVAERFSKGRVFLCGDAAHIHSPAGGQGMNTGMQDAINLAWKLAYVLKGVMPESVLSTYDIERRTVSRHVVENTDKAMAFVTNPKPLNRFLLNTLYPLATKWYQPRKMLSAMAQLEISYFKPTEKSREFLVKGKRLPWFDINASLNSFDLLDGVSWLLLVNRNHTAQAATSEQYGQLQHCAQGQLKIAELYPNQYYRPVKPADEAVSTYPLRHAIAGFDSAYFVLIRPDGYIHHIEKKNPSLDIVETLFSSPQNKE